MQTLPHFSHVSALEAAAFAGGGGGATGAGAGAAATFLTTETDFTGEGVSETEFRIFPPAFRVLVTHARMCEDLPGLFFSKRFPQCGQSSVFPVSETGFFTASPDTRRCGFRPRKLVSFLFGTAVSSSSSSSSSVNKSSFSGSISSTVCFPRPDFPFATIDFTFADFGKCFSQNIAPATFSFEQRHTPFVRVHLKASGTLSFDLFANFCV